MEALKMSTVMNRMFWMVSCLLSIAMIVLSINVLSFDKDIQAKPFGIHLKILRNAAQRLKTSCYEHQEKISMDVWNSRDTSGLRAVSTINHIMSFSDSADYFFSRLASLKGNSEEAKKYFHQYSKFSNRFTRAIRLGFADSSQVKNYVLVIDERLPAGKFSFDSEQEVQLLALLLEIEFYETVQRSIFDLASYCENW